MLRRRAFTMIELLVVIAIVALLVGLLLPVLAMARKSARNAATKTTIHNLNIALDNYKLDWKLYPIKPGGSNVIFDTGGGSYNPGYWQVPCVARGVNADGSEDNKDLVALLLDQKFLDVKKTNIKLGQLLDHFNTPLIARFLVQKPTMGDGLKLVEKPYIWSYGSDQKNGVDATPGGYTNAGLPDYDKAETDKIEASPGKDDDDIVSWH